MGTSQPDLGTFPFKGAVTWSQRLSRSEDGYQVTEYDLSTDTRTAVSEVRLPRPPDLALERHLVTRPKLSPVDDTALVGTWLGPPGAYQEHHGRRDHTALLDVGPGAIRQLFEPFIDGTPVEREHGHWRWNRVAVDPTPVTLAASVTEQLVPCTVPPPFTNARHRDTSLWTQSANCGQWPSPLTTWRHRDSFPRPTVHGHRHRWSPCADGWP